jgi:hypothetical protein
VRYTTPIFNEVANLFGKFAEARAAGEINIQLFQSPNFDAPVLLTFSGCTEISGSRAGGFATYFWPSSGIASPPALGEEVEYLYQMVDTITTRTAEGKFVLGGHPDESALVRATVDVISGFGPAPTPAAVSDQVWDETATDHVTAGTTGRDQYDTRRHLTNRRRIISGVSPWTENVYADDGTTLIQTAELKDLAGADITDSNAPAGPIVAERDPV